MEGNGSDGALRIIDKRQGDGVKKPAGWATTALRRLDRARLDFHQGRRFDGKRGRGRAGLRGWDAIDIDCNGPVVVVEVHDRHDRRGSRALRNRRRGRNGPPEGVWERDSEQARLEGLSGCLGASQGCYRMQLSRCRSRRYSCTSAGRSP